MDSITVIIVIIIYFLIYLLIPDADLSWGKISNK